MNTRAYAPQWLAVVVVVGTLTLAGCTANNAAEEETPPSSSASTTEATDEATDSATSSAPAETTEPAETTAPPETTEPAETPEPTDPATSEPAAEGVCTAGMLDAVLETEMGGGAAGSVYRQLIFTNISDRECDITGYPGVSFVDAAGNQVGAPAEREPGESPEVKLAPGESAIAAVKQTRAENFGADCQVTDTTGLRVYPPNATDSLVVDQAGTACAATSIVIMSVSPAEHLAPQ